MGPGRPFDFPHVTARLLLPVARANLNQHRTGLFHAQTIASPLPILASTCVRAQCLHLRRLASMDDRNARAGDAARSATPAQPARPTPTPSTAAAARPGAPKVVQPKPQALPSRAGPSSILVSPRQKGNPILNSVKSTAWEYSDIPADYVLGATTCALFLSLKYHRLHPEYIYNRIRDLKGQYDLRIILTMVDVESHEDSLRELSKTSLVNNVTIMLCWSAQEAGRYLELFKTFEHAAPTSIRAKQSSTYSENMVEFITVPRGINKTDAVGLVSNFGSIRTAINAGPEEIGLIAGWGDKKVQRWCNAVKEPFRVKKAARRGLTRENTQAGLSRDVSIAEGESRTPGEPDVEAMARQRLEDAVPFALNAQEAATSNTEPDADTRPEQRPAEIMNEFDDDEEALKELERAPAPAPAPRPAKRKQVEEDVSDGVMAALSKLRKQ
ncbi:ssDNA endonuclease and repair protein rad10 [Curvularia kusanoi]|uniref:SsDNA endonuclease and repair protein rad10 n=1 Tax=Curvularia kusanoi TaxID=90978 RepID=A0A9P4W5E9_CURKU|nr:ssDNA endonuclease and repair protein rad10 [Curvularia kusanoi]